MFEASEYQLIDFGNGRKLERFADVVVDRPSPAAEQAAVQSPELWKTAAAKFVRGGNEGQWQPKSFARQRWEIRWRESVFALKPTDFGHLGVFVEQARNWQWIQRRVAALDRPKVLNLFAYTGGGTLAAAAAGADVVHVDAAKNVVGWARQNAKLSGLADAPIRWIAEDATKFVERELKRGNHYDAVILDPPSYGHGPKAEVWKIQRDLMPLLRSIAKLTEGRRKFILLTCHSPSFGPAELQACLADAIFGSCQAGAGGAQMQITGQDGRPLPAGAMARWP
jgi:23S rRNA (cytosine1962-C5)-methyltransferase